MIDWDLVPVAALAAFRNGYAFKPDHQGSVGRPIVRIEQFLNPDVEPARYDGDDIPKRNHIKAGDLIFSWSGTLAVGTWHREPAYLNQHLFRVDPRPGVDLHWLRWSLIEAIERMTPWMHGSAMTHITRRVLEEVRVPVPPRETQRRIADYLDAETARIDALIVKNDQVGALVEEHFAAKRELLVSGPQIALNYVLRALRQGSSPVADVSESAGPGEEGVLKLSAIRRGRLRADENKRLLEGTAGLLPVRAQQVLISRANTPALVGDVAFVDAKPSARLFAPDLMFALTVDTRRAEPAFVTEALLLSSSRGQLSAVARGSSQSMVKLRQQDVREVKVPIPSLEEQQRALQALSAAREGVQRLLRHLAHQKDLLKERRQALITAAVTGEIEV